MKTPLRFKAVSETDPYAFIDVESAIERALNRSSPKLIQRLLDEPEAKRTAAWRRALEQALAKVPPYHQIDARIALYGIEFVRTRLWMVPRALRNDEWLAAWELVDTRWWQSHGVTMNEHGEIVQLASPRRAAPTQRPAVNKSIE